MKAHRKLTVIFLGAMAASFSAASFAENINPASLAANALTNSKAGEAGSNSSEHLIGNIFPGRVSGFTVSPDGRHVAYQAYANGKPDNVSEEGESGQVVVVLDGKKGAGRYNSDEIDKPIRLLIFSPDSKKLAYVASYGGWSVYVSGLDEQRLSGVKSKIRSGEYLEDFSKPEYTGINNVHGLTFSPDSKSVAYVASGYHSNGPSYIVVNGENAFTYPQIKELHYSPDSFRFAFTVKSPTYPPTPGEFVVVDGREGKHYSQIWPDRFVFSPDSKEYAYVAQSGGLNARDKGAELFVVRNGQEGKHYVGIGDYLKFSPDSQHLLYIAKKAEQKLSVVVDEKEGKVYDAWHIRNPAFSPDSKRVAYVVTTRPDTGESFIVLDGQEGKHYKGLGYPRFSSDSKRFVYQAGNGDKSFIVEDGVEGKGYPSVYGITFSPDGSQLAYKVSVGKYVGDGAFVVLNGHEGKKYDEITDLTFSPDGKYLVYAAQDRKAKKWFVVVNGKEGKAYDFVLANNAHEERDVVHGIENSSIKFDAPDSLRYLAISGRKIVLVEEKLKGSP